MFHPILGNDWERSKTRIGPCPHTTCQARLQAGGRFVKQILHNSVYINCTKLTLGSRSSTTEHPSRFAVYALPPEHTTRWKADNPPRVMSANWRNSAPFPNRFHGKSRCHCMLAVWVPAYVDRLHVASMVRKTSAKEDLSDRRKTPVSGASGQESGARMRWSTPPPSRASTDVRELDIISALERVSRCDRGYWNTQRKAQPA